MVHQVNITNTNRLQIFDANLDLITTEEQTDEGLLEAIQTIWEWAEMELEQSKPIETLVVGGRTYKLADDSEIDSGETE